MQKTRGNLCKRFKSAHANGVHICLKDDYKFLHLTGLNVAHIRNSKGVDVSKLPWINGKAF